MANSIYHEGKLYYSVVATAKLLGITKPRLKQIMASESLEWCNFMENGPIWISASSVEIYRKQHLSKT